MPLSERVATIRSARSVLHPLLQCRLHVEGVGARSTAAMSHAGRHEQPVEALDLARRLAWIVLAAKEREHTLVVVDAVLGRDQLIDPPVVLNQPAPSLLERAEVRIVAFRIGANFASAFTCAS